MSLQFLSTVSRFPSGLAGSTTVTPQTTNGAAAPATDALATVGIVAETLTPGTYTCLVTYPNADVALPYTPWVHWNVNGSLIDDYAPLPLFVDPLLTQGPFKSGQSSQIDFYLVASIDHVTPATGKTVTAQRAIAGAGFSAATGTVAEIGFGAYRLTASAADMTGTDMLFLFTASGADPAIISVNTSP
jgi:hypothetical protein